MAAEYKVYIKGQDGILTHQTNVWRTLRYTKRVNGVHDISLQLELDHPAVESFSLDGQIEAWRRNVQEGVDWYLDFEGMMRTPVDQLFENGRETYTIYGFGYNELLARRGIWYRPGTSYTEKSDVAETIIKQFVNENSGPGATNPPRISDGVTQGLAISPDQARGSSWTGARAYRNLLATVQEVAQDSETFFDVVGIGPAEFLFNFYENQRGTDRSTIGLSLATGRNGAGNRPVVFSAGLGNLQSLAHSVNRSDEITAVLALGQGIEEDRDTVEVDNSVAIAASPWNRREQTYNASQEQSIGGLTSAASAQLLANQKATTFTFTPLLAAATILGREFDWGDIVTARYQGEDFHLNIIGKTTSIDANGESISLEMNSVI